MRLPDRFILAGPVTKNKYVHYLSLWIDMEKRVIWRTFDHHNCSYTGFSRFICRDDGVKTVAQKRLAGKLEYHDGWLPITNGMAEVFWVDEFRNTKRFYPVRFEPYKACFVSHNYVSHCDDPTFDNLLDQIDKFISRDECLKWRSNYGDYGLSFDHLWHGIEADLAITFNSLSLSQIKLVADNRFGSSSKPTSLEQVYAPHKEREFRRAFHGRHSIHALDEFEAIFPIEKQAEQRAAITKSIARHIRRMPSLATKRFLKMIAAMGFALSFKPQTTPPAP